MRNNKFALFLSLIVFIVYIPSLFCGFVWLDSRQIEEETLINHSLKELFMSFSSPLQMESDSYYRPLVKLSFTLDKLFFGKYPFGFHLSSIFLHLLNTLLVFYILKRFAAEPHTFFITLFWAVHPVGVFAVTWISARAELLFSLFLLLAFYLYLRYRETAKEFISGHLF